MYRKGGTIMKVTIIEEDGTVNIRDIIDGITEIPAMLDSGFVSAILRVNNGKIEYAHIIYDVDSNEYTKLTWKEPKEIESD